MDEFNDTLPWVAAGPALSMLPKAPAEQLYTSHYAIYSKNGPLRLAVHCMFRPPLRFTAIFGAPCTPRGELPKDGLK
jgi:hypothetical protein